MDAACVRNRFQLYSLINGETILLWHSKSSYNISLVRVGYGLKGNVSSYLAMLFSGIVIEYLPYPAFLTFKYKSPKMHIHYLHALFCAIIPGPFSCMHFY